jgi:hypothetical protein
MAEFRMLFKNRVATFEKDDFKDDWDCSFEPI